MGTTGDQSADAAWFAKGTITATGQGGDMEMGDLNVVSGQSYKINAWNLEYFKDFSY